MGETARSGKDYDRIDLLIAPESEGEGFVLLSVSPSFRSVRAGIHRSRPGVGWDESEPLQGLEIPVEISTQGDTWRFHYVVAWKEIEFGDAIAGGTLHLNIDRWNMFPMAWWASWAITPHHYYTTTLHNWAVWLSSDLSEPR